MPSPRSTRDLHALVNLNSGSAAGGWAVAMALSPVLEIQRILQRRSSSDMSLAYLIRLVVGFALWISHGAAIHNLVLIIPKRLALIRVH